MNLDLAGKGAAVCGGTRGIGRAVALELAAMGAEITLVARDEAALSALAHELPKRSGQAHRWIAADFERPAELAEKLKLFLATHRAPLVLVNNTGGPPGGLLHEASADELTRAWTQHLLAGQALVKALVPGMRTAGWGRIVNIVSTSVKQPIRGLGVSNTVRGAVAAWAKTLAGELGPHGITVNNVLPGATRTGRLESLAAARAEREGRDVAAVFREMEAEVPLGRIADPAEIAAAVAFLASPAASYVNGINLPVDGGRLGCL